MSEKGARDGIFILIVYFVVLLSLRLDGATPREIVMLFGVALAVAIGVVLGIFGYHTHLRELISND